VYRLGQFCLRSDGCGSAYVTSRGAVGGWTLKKLIVISDILSENDDP